MSNKIVYPAAAVHPTAEQKATHHFFFPLGTRLKVKEDEADKAWPCDGKVYVVSTEPRLAHDDHQDWTVGVKPEAGGPEREAFVIYFRRVPEGA